MAVIMERTYSPEELLGDPALEGHELIDGRLRLRSTSERSSRIAGQILWHLSSAAQRDRGALVYAGNLGYRCFPGSPRTVRFPNASVVRASRRAEISDDSGYMPIPADLAVEVLSPNDRLRDVDEKIDAYLKAGFRIVWVVNPHRRHVHVCRPGRAVRLLNEGDEITGEVALSGFRCKVAAFFDV